jgi:hypothetical protein
MYILSIWDNTIPSLKSAKDSTLELRGKVLTYREKLETSSKGA